MAEAKILNAPMEVKDFDDELGTFVGFASVFGNVDLHGDVVEPGAFTKTIQERPTVKILFNHNTNLPIGVGTLENHPHGLIIRARLNLGTQTARDVYSNLKAGVLDALSIGYDVVKSRVEGGVRKLKELKLWEVSVVTIPANPQAQIIGVKQRTALDAETVAFIAEQTRRMQEDMASITARQLSSAMVAAAAGIKRAQENR
jgi:HK97 family phage prohead protease